MSTIGIQPVHFQPPVVPVVIDIPHQEDPTYSLCDNVTSCLLGRVDLNLRNIFLLVGIVASVAGTILTYLSGSLYFASHFAVSAAVSIYSFFEMRDVELARELNGALGQVKTQYLQLRENTQAVAVEAARLETTNEDLSTRNTELQETRASLEEQVLQLGSTRDQLQLKLVSLEDTKNELQSTADQLAQKLDVIVDGDKVYQENLRKISETTAEQQRARDELMKIQSQFEIVQKLLSTQVERFEVQNDRLASITTTQTQLLSPVRNSNGASQSSTSPDHL